MLAVNGSGSFLVQGERFCLVLETGQKLENIKATNDQVVFRRDRDGQLPGFLEVYFVSNHTFA